MTVFLDDWPGGGHLLAFDASGRPDLDELHAFAKKLGFKREWYQEGPQPWLSHYDVTTRRARRRALEAGALAITWRGMGSKTTAARLALSAEPDTVAKT